MKSRTLVILAVIAVALAAWILLVERHGLTSEEAAQQDERALPGLERDGVEALVLSAPNGPVRLERRDGSWWVASPVEAAADDGAVSSLLGALEGLRVQRRLMADDADLAGYGLEAPALAVAIELAQGPSRRLEIGHELPLGSNRAVRVDGGDILVVPGWFVSSLDKPVDDWRSRSLVDATPAQVASIQVVSASDRLHAVQLDDRWQLLDPVADLGDREALQTLVSDLGAARIVEFVDRAGADASEMGLEPPRLTVSVVRADGRPPVQLEFGDAREVAGETRVACRRGDEVLWIDHRAETALGKAAVRYRAPVLYPFDTWEAQRLSIAADGGHVEVERRDGVWRLVDGGEADSDAVTERLSVLSSLAVTDYDLLAPGSEEQGRVELGIGGGTGSAEATDAVEIVFFRALIEGGPVAVTVTGRPGAMAVAASDAAALLAAPESLRGAAMPAGEASPGA